jgi:hypothetical protein
MDSFLKNVGILAIAFIIIYGYKKILDYYELKRSSFYEDDKVYEAADEFVVGAAPDDVKAILAGCFDLDKEAADKILSRSLPHRTDKDGGYHAFIASVNKILGIDVYNEQNHVH